MKVLSAFVLAAATSTLVSASPAVVKRASPQGIDGQLHLYLPSCFCLTIASLSVSNYQGSINWNTVKANGVQFAYIKATEGTSE